MIKIILLLLLPVSSFAGGSGSGPGIICESELKCPTIFVSAKFINVSFNNEVSFALLSESNEIVETSSTEDDLENNNPEILKALEKSFNSVENEWIEI